MSDLALRRGQRLTDAVDAQTRRRPSRTVSVLCGRL